MGGGHGFRFITGPLGLECSRGCASLLILPPLYTALIIGFAIPPTGPGSAPVFAFVPSRPEIARCSKRVSSRVGVFFFFFVDRLAWMDWETQSCAKGVVVVSKLKCGRLSDEGCDSSILKATLLDWKFDRESGFPFFLFFNSSHVFDRARFTVSIFFFLFFIGRRIFVTFNGLLRFLLKYFLVSYSMGYMSYECSFHL